MTPELLYARLEDVLSRAERGEAAYSCFLNEAQRALAQQFLNGISTYCRYRFFGGYDEAERTRLFVYGDYYDFDSVAECIAAVEIRGSGYESLQHSAYLGALMALGIDRAKLGDIVVKQNSAIVFADRAIAEFLLSNPCPLDRVGRDTVRLFKYDITRDFTADRSYKDIFDTVASPRLDCVVSALGNISREKAKKLCTGALVQLNYFVEERPDTEVKDGDMITIRSVGKFRVCSVSEKTKKERYKLTAKKYI